MFKVSTLTKYSNSTLTVLFLYFLLLPLFLCANSNLLNNYDIIIASKDQNKTNSNVYITIKNTKNSNIYIPTREIDINNDIFSVKFNGQEVPYIGREIKRKQNNNINYITLEPEEIYVFEVTLSKYYKMIKKGKYHIQYKTSDQIRMKKKSNIRQALIKDSKVFSLNFSPAPTTKYPKSMRKIGNYNQCSQIEINTIILAHQKSLFISENASNTINTTTDFMKSDRYNTWFGTTTNANTTIVKTSINNIADTLKNKNINFDCSCSEPYLAYIHSNEPYTIYLCNGFWNAELEGTDSQSGTIIHQLSHFNIVASAQNYSYGKEDTKNLATLYPHYAIYNADSYEYFMENTPYLTMNNIFSSAQDIHIENRLTLTGTLNYSYDKNMFKITVAKTGMYKFFSSGNLDTQGTLYKSENIILKYNDDTSFDNLNFSLSAYLSKGLTYYLKVNTYENNSGNYTLNIDSDNRISFLVPILYLLL